MRVISVLVVDVCAIGMYAVAKRYLNDSVANIVLAWCILLGLSGCAYSYSDTFSYAVHGQNQLRFLLLAAVAENH